MRKLIFASCLAALFTSCDNKTTEQENPFFSEWNTKFGTPVFEDIKNEHFKPAFLEGMKQHNAEIQTIISNNDAPTFENTIEALEFSGKLMSRVSKVFYNLSSAETNDDIKTINEEISPLMSAHNENLNLNAALFERIKSIYNNKSNLSLSRE